MIWTVVNNSRRIIASGNTRHHPPLIPNTTLILGVKGDYLTQQATDDFQGLEPRPPLDYTAGPLTVGVREAVTIVTAESVRVKTEDFYGVLPVGGGTIGFEEAGTYEVRLMPEDHINSLSLPVSFTVTVTSGGTAVLTDLLVGELQDTLSDDVRTKLGQFDLAISRAEARQAAAEEIRTRSITSQAEAIAALRDLAAIERQTNNDLALTLGYIRRGLYALVELVRRRF